MNTRYFFLCLHLFTKLCNLILVFFFNFVFRNMKYVACVFIQLLIFTTVSAQWNDCFCLQYIDPVCGWNGQTYSNSGCAECAGVSVRCQGECPCSSGGSNCDNCAMIYSPVCGIDGRTYGNSCLARCRGVFVFRPGRCYGSPW
ncbi:serine protease inhibitor dipetalogastin-like [Ostrea edulis]|uniref:serine protease inhibitor dipetalogastin-like n=1 Tax=Ostrea edulis TaxID=37623 RepID=UPI0024AF3CC8|nr:serine protease inhibitor dipetalogastin-like [Ostrea edulis]